MHFTMPAKPAETQQRQIMIVPGVAFELHRFCGLDGSRYALSSVRFSRVADGRCCAVATDGRQLARLWWKDSLEGPSREWSAMIPASTCRELLACIDRKHDVTFEKRDDIEGYLSVKCFERIELIQGRFPRYQEIFDICKPVKHGTPQIHLCPKLLGRAMKVFRIYGEYIGMMNVRFEMPHDGECDPIRMVSGDEGLEIVQMPMGRD